ncbi:MAG: 2-amino-4-hydroxy-6-hydroxymethyldihydropteridine diphosphokinase [Anaerolineales bacterium]|nr:2-amino-4-hydroxy-6-hydroxymethyldihydropteridine diphosphokinase [Anaerolineales bacterium]MCZ2122260.1 2-amino-4-hydroxy-6-hydroxymethyldihydropteridine diphosphokinase [Anaerolineales bacterium]
MDHTVYLALGSNMGMRLTNLKNLINNLTPQMNVRAKSFVYETQPWGYQDQPPFLNQVICVDTYLQAEPLLQHLKRLEVALGRAVTFENGPRVIDVDILFYDDLVLDEAGIQIPHPRLHERAFVLAPLADLAPALVHPVLNQSVSQMLAALDQSGIQKYEGK